MRKDPDNDTEEGGLSRWSRRKAESARGRVAPDTAPPEDILTPDPVETALPVQRDSTEAAEPAAEKILTDEDMPPVESLNEDSDFSGFLSPGVSAELRKLALRKLFRSATFNVRDGLDDYDDDFRSFESLGDLITSDMKHREEMRELRRKQAEEERAEKEQALAESGATTDDDQGEEGEGDEEANQDTGTSASEGGATEVEDTADIDIATSLPQEPTGSGKL